MVVTRRTIRITSTLLSVCVWVCVCSCFHTWFLYNVSVDWYLLMFFWGVTTRGWVWATRSNHCAGWGVFCSPSPSLSHMFWLSWYKWSRTRPQCEEKPKTVFVCVCGGRKVKQQQKTPQTEWWQTLSPGEKWKGEETRSFLVCRPGSNRSKTW